jgi:hypothetical protein
VKTAKALAIVNLIAATLWVLAIYPTLVWWKQSVLWVALMSLWANFASHIAAWIAARAEMSTDQVERIACRVVELLQEKQAA